MCLNNGCDQSRTIGSTRVGITIIVVLLVNPNIGKYIKLSFYISYVTSQAWIQPKYRKRSAKYYGGFSSRISQARLRVCILKEHHIVTSHFGGNHGGVKLKWSYHTCWLPIVIQLFCDNNYFPYRKQKLPKQIIDKNKYN